MTAHTVSFEPGDRFLLNDKISRVTTVSRLAVHYVTTQPNGWEPTPHVSQRATLESLATAGLIRQAYTLTLRATDWACTCPGAFNQDGMYQDAREAARDAVHHARYYGETWPHTIVRAADHGYVCKHCNEPSPMGIGFVAPGRDAAMASTALDACQCGYSRKP